MSDASTTKAVDANLTIVAPKTSVVYAWYVVFVLCLCQTIASIDSKLPLILAESIKADLGLSDSQLGLIIGPAFTLTYAICALPIAKLADRGRRVTVVGVAIIAWSLCTAAAGASKGFGTFLLSRIGVAVGEAALTPSAHSLISGHHDEVSRFRAIGVYHLGLPLGMFIALFVGGYLNDLFGWRSAFLVVGVSGLALAPLVLFTVREALQPISAITKRELPKGGLKSLFKNPVLRNLLLAGLLFGLGTGALGSWGPAYVMRTFNFSATETGASYGAVIGLLGMIGTVGGGFVGAALAKSGAHFALRALAIAIFVSFFTQIGALLLDSYTAFLALTGVTVLLSTFYLAPTYATVQSSVDPSARSFASAVSLFMIGGIGLGFGAFAAGFISDSLRVTYGAESLRWALIYSTAVKLGAVYFYWRSSQHLKALEASQRSAA